MGKWILILLYFSIMVGCNMSKCVDKPLIPIYTDVLIDGYHPGSVVGLPHKVKDGQFSCTYKVYEVFVIEDGIYKTIYLNEGRLKVVK